MTRLELAIAAACVGMLTAAVMLSVDTLLWALR